MMRPPVNCPALSFHEAPQGETSASPRGKIETSRERPQNPYGGALPMLSVRYCLRGYLAVALVR